MKINNGNLKILIPLDISHFDPHIRNIKNALETTRYLCNQTQIIEVDSECHNRLQPLTVRHQDISNEFESISHLFDNRVKRAWIGGIGSILKQIFGTLDENDALRYNDAIESIQSKQKQLTSLMKENILVTTSIISSYNDTLSKIKDNEANLNEAIDNLSLNIRNISEFTNGLHILYNVDQIFNNLETSILTLSFQLEDVTNAILFSRLNILHPAIITTSQLYRELANNYRHLPSDSELPVTLDINTIQYILGVSKLVCYYIDHKIVFVLQIPLVSISEYLLFHNIALPTLYSLDEPNKFSLILPSSKYIAMTKDNSHYCNLDSLTSCKEVNPGSYICDVTNVYATDAKPTCESELLTKVIKEIPKQCDTRFIFGKLDVWKPLSNNRWIFVQSEPNKISIDCVSSNLYETTVFGTGVLTVPTDCTGHYKSTTLIPKHHTVNITSPVNSIPDFNLINNSCCNIVKFNNLVENMSPVRLQNIDLDKLNSINKIMLKSLLDNLEEIDTESHIVKYGTHYSILVILVLLIIVFYLLYLVYKRIKVCNPGNNRAPKLKSVKSISIKTDAEDVEPEFEQPAQIRTQV